MPVYYEIGSKNSFASNFTAHFLKDKKLSAASAVVYEAGLNIWKYYFSKNPKQANASFYDIKEFFKGRDLDTGKMKNKSDDETFNDLTAKLSVAMSALAKQIEKKVYEYGFLKGN
ncbi:MAG: hypothetical protein LBH29_04260 [Elusimicrobiota bacterium]|nr:hypothetical protein [Elusimicrobiota bacterium]